VTEAFLNIGFDQVAVRGAQERRRKRELEPPRLHGRVVARFDPRLHEELVGGLVVADDVGDTPVVGRAGLLVGSGRDVLHLGDGVAGAAGDAVVDRETIGVEAMGAPAGLMIDGKIKHFPRADVVKFDHTDGMATVSTEIVAIRDPLRLDPGAHILARLNLLRRLGCDGGVDEIARVDFGDKLGCPFPGDFIQIGDL
jgi:hypothetical protein